MLLPISGPELFSTFSNATTKTSKDGHRNVELIRFCQGKYEETDSQHILKLIWSNCNSYLFFLSDSY
ncbi:hypothetical protein GmHk_06G017617 [Glycine max]|nr:hypothetical protein GmHk_06G017617 [Glycine max]